MGLEPHLRPTPVMATRDPIPNPVSQARDPTCILMDTGRIRFCCDTTGNPCFFIFKLNEFYHIYSYTTIQHIGFAGRETYVGGSAPPHTL